MMTRWQAVKMTDKFESVFDAIADFPEEALNMKLRASLIREIRTKVTDADGNCTSAWYYAAQSIGFTAG